MKDGNGSGKSKDVKHVPNPNGVNGDPISLNPMSPEEAIRRLLAVPPESKEKHQNEHK